LSLVPVSTLGVQGSAAMGGGMTATSASVS
jgi:hypothetical protein